MVAPAQTSATARREALWARVSSVSLISLTASLAATGAFAGPFPSHDAVTKSMGGTGVASTDPAIGALRNPSALAVQIDTPSQEPQWFVLPHGGFQSFDPDDLKRRVDNLQDDEDGIQATIDTVDRFRGLQGGIEMPNQGSFDELTTSFSALEEDLRSLEGSTIVADGSAAITLNRATRGFGWGIQVNEYAAVSAIGAFDDGFLTGIRDEIEACRVEFDTTEECETARIRVTTAVEDAEEGEEGQEEVIVDEVEFSFSADELESTVIARGIRISEMGLSLAKGWGQREQEWTLGVTLKAQNIETYDYVAVIGEASTGDIDNREHRESESDVNIDVGMQHRLTPRWRLGLAVQNAISRTYETPNGDEIDVDPRARVGAAYLGDGFTVSAEADLNTSPAVGFEEDTRHVGIGGEFDVMGLDRFKLRGGYRADLEDSERNVASIGLGISLMGFAQLHFAAMGNSDESGAAIQFGTVF